MGLGEEEAATPLGRLLGSALSALLVTGARVGRRVGCGSERDKPGRTPTPLARAAGKPESPWGVGSLCLTPKQSWGVGGGYASLEFWGALRACFRWHLKH